MLALSVDDEDASFARGARFLEESEDAFARGFGGEAVQVERSVDWKLSAPERAKQVRRRVDAPAFDALAVVGDFEAGAVIHDAAKVIERFGGRGFRLFAKLGWIGTILGTSLARDRAHRDACMFVVERSHAAHETGKGEIVVRRRRWR